MLAPNRSAPLPHLLVSAATDDYFWGVLLLVGSLRMHGCEMPLLVLSLKISRHHLRVLGRLRNVVIVDAGTREILAGSLDGVGALPARDRAPTMFPLKSPLFKPMAMMMGFELAETVTWIDADNMAWGDITPLLTADFEGVRIRVREGAENAEVFRGYPAADDDDPPGIPRAILARWREDVGGLSEPLLRRQVVTNCFSLNRCDRDLLYAWAGLMNDTGVADAQGVVRRDLDAYFMTDESALTALLAFHRDAPILSRYNLDDVSGAHLIHFGRHPKPWRGWQLAHMDLHYERVQSVVSWLRANAVVSSHVPAALNPRFKPVFHFQALIRDGLRRLRGALVS